MPLHSRGTEESVEVLCPETGEPAMTNFHDGEHFCRNCGQKGHKKI